jgi:hypothetical protein
MARMAEHTAAVGAASRGMSDASKSPADSSGGRARSPLKTARALTGRESSRGFLAGAGAGSSIEQGAGATNHRVDRARDPEEEERET